MLVKYKKKIAILGVGYVGLPLAIELSKFYRIVAYDENIYKIKNLINGIDKNNQYSPREILKR